MGEQELGLARKNQLPLGVHQAPEIVADVLAGQLKGVQLDGLGHIRAVVDWVLS